MLQKLDLRQRIGTQLVTSLLTSPITYVPHYHFAMVDELLRDLSAPSETGHRLMSLTGINILEFDMLRGVVRDFITKDFHEYYTDYQDLGRWMEYLAFPGNQPPTLGADKPVVCLFKNLFDASQSFQLQTFLLDFAASYRPERGLSRLIVDPTPAASLG